jgi:hypothetical protein
VESAVVEVERVFLRMVQGLVERRMVVSQLAVAAAELRDL